MSARSEAAGGVVSLGLVLPSAGYPEGEPTWTPSRSARYGCGALLAAGPRNAVTVPRFDPATDVTLDELRIELTYPLDPAADRFFRDQDLLAASE